MRLYLAASLSLAMIAPAAAQDVQVYSRDSADALLNAPVAEDAPDTCAKDMVRLPDGSCSRTRRFSLPNRSDNTSQPASTPGLTLSRGKPVQTGATRLAAKPQKPKPSRGSEVPLQFKAGSSELSPQSMTNLRTLATALNSSAHSGKRIQIVGHTDRSGGQEANRRLSQQRADAAATYLASQGVDRDRIDAVGKGFDAPLAGVNAYSPRQRRVEVVRTK